MRFTAGAKHLVPGQAPLFEDALHRLCDAGRDPGGHASSNAFLQFLFVLGLQLRAQGMTVGFILFVERGDRKSTRLNSSHVRISYAVFCLKKKKQRKYTLRV